MSLFEHLAATDDSAAIAHRKAIAVANKRVKDRFGPFFANAAGHTDLAARLALVEDDVLDIVRAVVTEYGGDTDKITAAIKRSIAPSQDLVAQQLGVSPHLLPQLLQQQGAPGPGGMTGPAGASMPGMMAPGQAAPPPTGPAGPQGLAGAPPGGVGATPGMAPNGPPPGMMNMMGATRTGNPMELGAPGASVAPVAPGVPGAAPGGPSAICPQCGGPMINGQCPKCGASGGTAAPGMPAAGGYGSTHTIPQQVSTGPIQAAVTGAGGFCDKCRAWKSGPKAGCTCDGDGDEGGEAAEDTKESSVRESRRPKLCPYHSEVVDISLGAGEPQAGFNAMSSHAWGDKHCKGGFEGSCNFRPQMVTTKYWDDKRAEYDERREQREQDRLTQPAFTQPELSIDTEPIMHAEPLSDEPGKEGVSDIDGELANAPSAVGGELSMAASTKEAEALTTVKLPRGDQDAQGGPSPKIDKGNSGDQFGWSLEPIDTDTAGTPHPTRKQDPTDKAEYNKDDFLDQTRAVTDTVELDSAPNLMDDAGFAPGGEEHGPHTDTWTGTDGLAKPVTRESLSAIDPDKNPIRELMDEYSGFLMPTQVEAAVREWDIG